MCKLVMFTLIFVVSTVCLQAQNQGQSSATSSDLTTVQGCLKISMGRYTLTEEDGTLHYLAGAAGKLGHQVDRQIEITGKPGIRTLDSTLVGAASSAVEQPVIEVKTVKRIADACK